VILDHGAGGGPGQHGRALGLGQGEGGGGDHASGQPFQRIGDVAIGAPHQCFHVNADRARDRSGEIVLVLEMVEERSLGDAGCGDHFVDGDRVHRAFGQQFQPGGEQGGAGARGAGKAWVRSWFGP
jgi:hypothetical protein